MGAHLTNGSRTPDGHHVPFLDTSVNHAVPGCRQDIGQEESFLVGYVIWNGEQVDIAIRNPKILGLAAGEAAREMRVPKHSRGSLPIKRILNGILVGLFALREELFPAVRTGAARNREGNHNTVANFNLIRLWPYTLDHTTAFMTKDITFLQLGDNTYRCRVRALSTLVLHGPLTMIQVKIASTDRAAGYLDDHIAWIDNSRHGHLH